jgi:diacylglycerol kinase (ATP)
MTVGLIINPLSGRKGGMGERLRRCLRKNVVEVVMLESFADLPAMLAHMAGRGIDALAISSGDGTVHAIQTELAERRPFERLPKLVLLPHGTANLSASQLGVHRSPEEVARLLESPSALDTLPMVVKPTLRVANPADGRPRHGMFMGTGAIYTATAYCQEVVHRAGLRGNTAIVATFLRCLFGGMLGRGDPSPSPIARKYALRVSADGTERFSPDGLLFLATTLDSLMLGARPFWGGRTGPIRATALPYPIRHIWRWVWPALYGAETRRMPEGATSFCAQSLEISGPTPYVIDGEFFEPPPNAPLRINTGPDFVYLRG